MHAHEELWRDLPLWSGRGWKESGWLAVAERAKAEGVYAAATSATDAAACLHLYAHWLSERPTRRKIKK